MQILSQSLRKQFVKDMSLPISLTQDPYFDHHIKALDKQYKTQEKLNSLYKDLSNFPSEEAFLSEMKRVREEMIDYIKAKDRFTEFNEWVIPNNGYQVSKGSIYKEPFCGKRLISVDLREANFQSFALNYPDIVDHQPTYRDFAKQFTDVEYFLNSKKIRQVVFGNLNPKRQMQAVKYFMKNLHCEIMKGTSPKTKTLSTGVDEIILETDFSLYNLENVVHRTKYRVKVMPFELEKLPSKTGSIFIKHFPDGEFIIKGCPANYILETVRYLYAEPIQPLDRAFYLDGRVCEYKDALY